jgi:peroxiredoxin Q/BCP
VFTVQKMLGSGGSIILVTSAIPITAWEERNAAENYELHKPGLVSLHALADRVNYLMRTFSVFIFLGIFVPSLLRADALAVGGPAPQITATDQDGKPVNFSHIYTRGVTLIYFYPKAGSPGCTAEACSLRDSYAKLHAEGLHIIGVSRDTADSQKHFQDEYHLPFTLVADRDGQVARAFGVSSIAFFPIDSRESFIVKNGKIAWNSVHAKTGGSAEEVQQALDHLE